MLENALFPPVIVWWDGAHHWLSDGFTRCAAAERAGLIEILAEIHLGSLSDAQWDSYAANATHGIIRTRKETEEIVRLALRHPHAAGLSTVSIAKYLHMPESTVRYWRDKLTSSSQNGEDEVRIVVRGSSQYLLKIDNLGKSRSSCSGSQKRRDLKIELAEMKERASKDARSLLNIIERWALGQSSPSRCLDVIESFLRRASTLPLSLGSQSPLSSAFDAHSLKSVAARQVCLEDKCETLDLPE